MTAQQPDLTFTAPRASALARAGRPTTPAQVAELVDFLRGRGWMTAAQIIHQSALEGTRAGRPLWTKRGLRRLAEHGRSCILSFPGSRGYRVLAEANRDEILHGIRAHSSQAREHLRGSVALQRYQHGQTSQ